MAGTTGLEPATSAVTVNDLETRGERLRPPKSGKTAHFVDWIVDQELKACSSDLRVKSPIVARIKQKGV